MQFTGYAGNPETASAMSLDQALVAFEVFEQGRIPKIHAFILRVSISTSDGLLTKNIPNSQTRLELPKSRETLLLGGSGQLQLCADHSSQCQRYCFMAYKQCHR